ncbi:16S rRNA (guanine(966)-N(2))-methyltransferase RsmD [Candidatus Pandoraea novymonadis]|uniref:Ribosomal RNA small subunit methyltransferase D n=1 Tax=Candidatus Pandoraea novymonadis TaxID=1808959 RepID=A0ABX5FDC3_9BURK|nr:16S rRNA (guanine(966)-N(2))-methyltransferase RsmD [Candidatus Pandoraea novymonadis]PSB91763.1 Ribosomal RNA small subunit methyltransferase D [Candidatus Pandoraea novymonadis]
MKKALRYRDTRNAPQQVCIVGGDWKRTPLPVPRGDGLRPTPARVRETLFNWLGQDMTGLCCLDAFAGSGALGFEAASRGARRVLMIENFALAVRQLRVNQAKLQADTVEIVKANARHLLTRMAPGEFNIIFLDPPFNSVWLMDFLPVAARLLVPDGVIYVENNTSLSADALATKKLVCVRQAKVGTVHYHLLELIPNLGERNE